MLQYNKKSDLKRLLSRVVNSSHIIQAIFQDCPDLMSFSFEKTSEYDDNNYSDQVRVHKVNDWQVDWEGDYDGDEDESELPKVSEDVCRAVIDAVYEVAQEYDFGDYDIDRSEYQNSDGSWKTFENNNKEETKYLNSYLSNSKIEDKWFLKADPKWAAYYAEDHGRFDEKIEAKIFCKRGNMADALMYAEAIKEPLCDAVETFFTTQNLVDPQRSDDKYFKKYLLFKNGLKELCSKN